jgi:hypothetical protein
MAQVRKMNRQQAAEGYRRAAVYFADSDCVEYAKEDAFTVYDCVDEVLPLMYDDTHSRRFQAEGVQEHFRAPLKTQYSFAMSSSLSIL